jgi:hypothetical protein
MNENDLRDCFAMFAMGNLIQAYATISSRLDVKEICDGAYQYADAMLEARNTDEELGIAALKPKRKYARKEA